MAITTPCPVCMEQINLEDMNYTTDGRALCCDDCLITCPHGTGVECSECNSTRKTTTVSGRVPKVGKLENYINIPVTNGLFPNLPFGKEEKVIGVVTGVVEVDDMYELTIEIHDESILQKVDQPKSYSMEARVKIREDA